MKHTPQARGDLAQALRSVLQSRKELPHAKRIVIKVGSSSLTRPDGHLDTDRLHSLVEVIVDAKKRGKSVVLVSSGAQAASMGPLGFTQKPKTLAQAQAAASVGQGLLIAEYNAAFGKYGLRVGQVLLTAEDVLRRHHYRNARRALERLLTLGVVPIINENDTVATDEIRFGDNDRLAALVAHLIHADALILLTDVDALYTKSPSHPDAEKVRVIRNFSEAEALEVSGRGSNFGTGGMVTKIIAASMAMSSGIPVLLTSAENASSALAGEDVGTWFNATGSRLAPRQLWLAYAANIRGKIVVDEGAARAVTERNASLLPAGVVGSSGTFTAGDPVEIVDEEGLPIARGLAGFKHSEIADVSGKSMREIESSLGQRHAHEVVHRDELVVMARHRRVR